MFAPQVVAVALGISGSIFLVLSVGAAVAFGPSTDINALNNFSTAGLEPFLGWRAALLFSWVVRGGYLLCILATLLLFMHPLRSCLAQMLWPTPRACSSSSGSSSALATAVQPGGQEPVGAAGQQQQPAELTDPLLQQQQQPCGPRGCSEQQVDEVSDTSTEAAAAAPRQLWQDLEQAVYYPLTYGLLAAMVLTAVAVTNLFQAVSAVGDIASTTQAFIVPGAIAVMMTARQQAHLKAAAATAAAVFLNDVEQGPGGSGFNVPSARVSTGSVMYAAAGAAVLTLGVALFCNGLLERLDTLL